MRTMNIRDTLKTITAFCVVLFLVGGSGIVFLQIINTQPNSLAVIIVSVISAASAVIGILASTLMGELDRGTPLHKGLKTIGIMGTLIIVVPLIFLWLSPVIPPIPSPGIDLFKYINFQQLLHPDGVGLPGSIGIVLISGIIIELIMIAALGFVIPTENITPHEQHTWSPS